MQKHRYIQIEQIEVKITELVKYILNKYIIILTIALIFACGIPAVKYYFDSKTSTNIDIDNEEYKYEFMKLNLYQEQLDESYKQYQSILDYKEEAVIMQLDYNNIYTLTMQFIVNASEENLIDIMTAYSNYYANGNIAKDMWALDGTIEQKYLVELIRFNCSNYTNFETSSIINVKFYGKDEELCKKYGKTIKDVLEVFGKELDVNGKKNELSVLSETIVKGPVAEIKSIQDAKNVSLSNLENNITNLKIKIDNINNSVFLDNDGQQVASYDIKFMILGFALGIFLMSIILSVFYIFSNKIKYAEEIAEYSDLVLLGRLKFSKKKILDKFNNCGSDITLQKEIILNKIKMLYSVENEGISVISAFDEKLAGNIGDIFEHDELGGVKLNIVGDIVNDFNAMKMFSSSSTNIVLAISEMYTRYGQINNLIEICNIKESNILGYIYIE